MAAVTVGSLTLTSNIAVDGTASYTTSLPSGRKVVLTQDSLEQSKDPTYVEAKRAEVTSKLTDPADIAAVNSYYDNIGSQATNLQEELGTEILDQQIAADPFDEPDPNYPTLNATEELDDEYLALLGQDDDSGDERPPVTQDELEAWASTPGYEFMNTPSPAATTVAGKAGKTTATPAAGSQRRTYNPLSEFSSYNYQLSLYMVTPEAVNAYIDSGYVDRSNGWYIVAQSGGINNTPGAGKPVRAPGMDLDFHIDDLDFTVITSTKSSPVLGIKDISFKIYEPYGISFNSQLVSTAKKMLTSSKLANAAKNTNAISQVYALGIRFYGYDKNGTLMTGEMMANSDVSTTDQNALFEKFYIIVINSMDFRLDGRTVVYTIKAANAEMKPGTGVMRGTIPAQVNLVGSTVSEMLVGKTTTATGTKSSGTNSTVRGLIDFLNQKEIENCSPDPKNKNERRQIIPNEYAILFDEPELIGGASMVNPKDFDRYKDLVAMSPVSKTSESNTKAEEQYKTVDKNQRSYSFAAGTTILAAIEQVISNSSYITGALIQVGSSLKESEPAKNPNPTEFNWFTVVPEVRYGPFDEKTNQYSYKITYRVKKYTVPYVRSGFIKYTSAYPGPHKEYEYWYTGKNSEILKYEQTFNNLYFLTASGANQGTDSLPVPTKIQPSNGSTIGQPNKAAEGVNSVREDLYSPDDLLKAKIEILGDPDYLYQSTSAKPNLDNKPGSSFTINPTGGQVFIEISFKHVTDYYHGGKNGTSPGTMDISDDIRFYVYPGEFKDKIKAMTYLITEVKNRFSRGKFTQDLKVAIADLSQFTSNNKSAKPLADENRAETERLQRQNSNAAPNARTTDTTQVNPDLEAVSTNDEFGDLDGAIRTQQIKDEAAAMDQFYNFDNTSYGESAVSYDEFGSPIQDDDASSRTPVDSSAPTSYLDYDWAGDAGREEIDTTTQFGGA